MLDGGGGSRGGLKFRGLIVGVIKARKPERRGEEMDVGLPYVLATRNEERERERRVKL